MTDKGSRVKLGLPAGEYFEPKKRSEAAAERLRQLRLDMMEQMQRDLQERRKNQRPWPGRIRAED